MTPAGKKILPAFMLSSKTSADNQVGAKGESHDLPYESLLFFLFFFLFFLVFTLFSNPRHGYKASFGSIVVSGTDLRLPHYEEYLFQQEINESYFFSFTTSTL
jgi:hypothetical protein